MEGKGREQKEFRRDGKQDEVKGWKHDWLRRMEEAEIKEENVKKRRVS